MGDFSIQISSKLVNRLADDADAEKLKKPKKSKSKVSPKPQTTRIKVQQKPISDESEKIQGGGGGGGGTSRWPGQPSLFLPVIAPAPPAYSELDVIRSVLQESERVVEKLQKQEDNLVQEVTQRAKDLHEKEFQLPYQKPIPCLVESDACFQCYKENANNVLKCAPLVKTFAECNRRARQQAHPTRVRIFHFEAAYIRKKLFSKICDFSNANKSNGPANSFIDATVDFYDVLY